MTARATFRRNGVEYFIPAVLPQGCFKGQAGIVLLLNVNHSVWVAAEDGNQREAKCIHRGEKNALITTSYLKKSMKTSPENRKLA